MSLVPAGLTVLAALGQRLLSPVVLRPRSIGGIVADITIDEIGNDEMQITEHPVEQGASIADHAYKRPVSVVIRAGWSNSSYQALGNPIYVQQIYALLLNLQASRVPFDILTGKRIYTNMLVHRLVQQTDEKTEDALMITCECREVILVSTQTVRVPPSSMKFPSLNQNTTNQGNLALKPGTNYNAAGAP